jgi:hypothetical protein
VHGIGAGNSNGRALIHTIDTGSGLLYKSCGGSPKCPKRDRKLYTPSAYWAGCLGGPQCGYSIGFTNPSPSTVFDGGFVLTDAAGKQTCNFSVILEPSGYQGSECPPGRRAWEGGRAPAPPSATGSPRGSHAPGAAQQRGMRRPTEPSHAAAPAPRPCTQTAP